MAREIVIVGGGIVGVSVALELARRSDVRVTLIERDGEKLKGSTAFAPGFVGLYNDAPILVELAMATASAYRAAGGGFTQAGGLELATSEAGAVDIERRSRAARAAGLNSTILGPDELPEAIAAFVDARRIVAAAYGADDAVADPATLTALLRAQAKARGVQFASGKVIAIDAVGSQIAVTVSAGERFVADDVVLAGGVWGSFLAELVGLSLPLIPVAHPYVYSAANGRLAAGPFVRWPERHVYARVHGDRLGIGSYDHRPVPVGLADLEGGAGLGWDAAFDPVIGSAQQLLRSDIRFEPQRRINGVFAMTPDNLPFLGQHPSMAGVWVAQAIWVTHGAGAAARLVDAMTGGNAMPDELAVNRFAGQPANVLEDAALRLYRDIYANESAA